MNETEIVEMKFSIAQRFFCSTSENESVFTIKSKDNIVCYEEMQVKNSFLQREKTCVRRHSEISFKKNTRSSLLHFFVSMQSTSRTYWAAPLFRVKLKPTDTHDWSDLKVMLDYKLLKVTDTLDNQYFSNTLRIDTKKSIPYTLETMCSRKLDFGFLMYSPSNEESPSNFELQLDGYSSYHWKKFPHQFEFLRWQEILHFSDKNRGIYSLLPGLLGYVIVTPSRKAIDSNSTLKIYWPEFPDKHFYAHKAPKQFCVKNTFFINYSTIRIHTKRKMRHSHYFVYFLPFCQPRGVDWRHRFKRSWNQASQLCSSHGGYLPRIQSREELNEIISLFKIKNKKTSFHGNLVHWSEFQYFVSGRLSWVIFILFLTCKHVYTY